MYLVIDILVISTYMYSVRTVYVYTLYYVDTQRFS